MMGSGFPSPPEWSLFLGTKLGPALVWLAAGLFLASAIGWILAPRHSRFEKLGRWGFPLGAASLFGVFLVLAVLFANNRFEFEYVWSHADKANTLPYRIAGIWSGQQGSFLLWGVCSALFGLFAMRSAGPLRRWFTIPYALFLGGISGILAFETPFGLNLLNGVPVVPPDGRGLAPSLQNYWVTIHPPTIFLGFGSLTVLFAFGIAAMAEKDWTGWVPRARPWTILSITLVGLGLCMGGFWAYETLGWGGFWAWDPVENTSFVPWCLGVALLHGMIVQTSRNRWHASNLLFAGVPFLSFLYGTFLTRSGFLADTSVHSFAQMDRSALWILTGIGGVAVLTYLGVWIRSLPKIRAWQGKPEPAEGIHREGFYRAGNFLLVCFALATAFGMSVPLIQSMMGQNPKVVSEGLYHMVLSWLFVPLMILMAVAPFIRWRGERFWNGLGKLYGSFCITIGLLGVIMLILARTPAGAMIDLSSHIEMPFGLHAPVMPWIMFLLGLCLFAIVANTWRIGEMMRRSKTSIPAFLAHLGVATLMAGLILSRGFERKERLVVQNGAPDQGLGYSVAFDRFSDDLMSRNNKVIFQVEGPGGRFEARPGLYYLPPGQDGEERPMAWPHIERRAFHDIYFTLGAMVKDATDLIELMPGEAANVSGMIVRFTEGTRDGEAGQTGTRFGAKLRVQSSEGVFESHPQMELTDSGPVVLPAAMGPDYLVTMQGMDVASGAARIQIHFRHPLFPIELYYKPMTILVWGGTGILTLAGFWAAWVRRRAHATLSEESEALSVRPSQEETYAPASTAQI
jgi:cytochrome c-type biogenesis protein CcmF